VILRLALAALHLLALGIGLGAVHGRARALRELGAAPDALRRALRADAWWGAAAALWLATGLWRALAGTEKSPAYYWSNPVFHAKLGLFVLIFALELRPMVVLGRWRRGAPADAALGRRLAATSDVQTALLVLIVVAATAMARGYGARP
jgi:putative membrane protein